MDKKTQKRVAILRLRIQQLQKVLAGAKSQTDEPDEIERIEKEISETKSEIESLLKS